MHTALALLCFVVVMYWLIYPYPSGLLHWHCGNLTIAPSASKATLVNMGKCIMWIHYEWLHNHNKAKHNKTVCKFLGIYCRWIVFSNSQWCRRRHKGILLWNICRHDRHLFPSRERHRLHQCTGMIPGLRPANERRRYNVTPSFNWLGASLESALNAVSVGNQQDAKCASFSQQSSLDILHFSN